MKKVIKTRKERECSCCDNLIAKGSYAIYQEGRVPNYDEQTEEQKGILFFHAWFCNECSPLECEIVF